MKIIPNIPKPTSVEVESYLARWDSLENYVLQEGSLDKLFFKTYPQNNDIKNATYYLSKDLFYHYLILVS